MESMGRLLHIGMYAIIDMDDDYMTKGNELISIGFEKIEPYYSIFMPTGDVEKRAVREGNVPHF